MGSTTFQSANTMVAIAVFGLGRVLVAMESGAGALTPPGLVTTAYPWVCEQQAQAKQKIWAS